MNSSSEDEQSTNQHPPTVDGINLLDRSVEIACPRCEDQLRIGTLAANKVAGCASCHGCLIQSNVLATLVRILRASYTGEDKPPGPIDSAQLQRECDCPGCLQPMETHVYGGPGNVVIDSCIHCNLVWLDARELTQIIEAPGQRDLIPGTSSIEEQIVLSLQSRQSADGVSDMTLTAAFAFLFG